MASPDPKDLKKAKVRALLERARVYSDIKFYDQALADYDSALMLAPESIQAHNDRALLLQKIGRHDEALVAFERALANCPTSAELHFNSGNLLAVLDRHQDAAARFGQAVNLKPDWAQAHFNLANALRLHGQFAQAVASYQQAIELQPWYGQAYLNCGVALVALNRFDEAIACYASARHYRVDTGLLDYNMGNALRAAGHCDQALVYYDKVPASSASYNDAQWNKALALLLLGRYEAGWPLYEFRWRRPEAKAARRPLSSPKWTGKESLADKTLFVRCEQGHGDVFQFCRYAQLLANAGARVVLEVHPEQVTVLKTLTGIHQLCTPGDATPGHDCHCDLASLPALLGTRLESVPAQVPYLAADPAKVEFWGGRLGAKRKARVGVVWSSVSGFQDDHLRSLSLAQFNHALEPELFDYICLQKEIRPGDQAGLAQRSDIRCFSSEIADYSDTAALIEHCDLILSTCTSVPHLSGAMGKPTWLLVAHVPDFRWLLERADSPWYPTAKLYRQTSPGDWDAVTRQVRQDMNNLLQGMDGN